MHEVVNVFISGEEARMGTLPEARVSRKNRRKDVLDYVEVVRDNCS